MAASFGWGTLAASSLMIGAIISNLPEAISSTSGLATAGWKSPRTLWMWIGIALVLGLAPLAGDALFQHSPAGHRRLRDPCARLTCRAPG